MDVGTRSARGRRTSLNKVAEADGTLVKPDTPLEPDDATYLRDAATPGGAMVATTGRSKARLAAAGYVFAYARNATLPARRQTTYQAENSAALGSVVRPTTPRSTADRLRRLIRATGGDYVQWTVNAPTSGTYTLMFRYADGAGAAVRWPSRSTRAPRPAVRARPPTGHLGDADEGLLAERGQRTPSAPPQPARPGRMDQLGVSAGNV